MAQPFYVLGLIMGLILRGTAPTISVISIPIHKSAATLLWIKNQTP